MISQVTKCLKIASLTGIWAGEHTQIQGEQKSIQIHSSTD